MISEWNVCSRIKAKLPRTNNPVEGINNAIHKTLMKEHPTIWEIIEAFQNEEAGAVLKMNHVARGDKVRQQKIYKDINEQLQNMIEDYENVGKKDRMKFLMMASLKLKKLEIADVENNENEVKEDVE